MKFFKNIIKLFVSISAVVSHKCKKLLFTNIDRLLWFHGVSLIHPFFVEESAVFTNKQLRQNIYADRNLNKKLDVYGIHQTKFKEFFLIKIVPR